MSLLLWPLVISVTVLAAMLGAAWWIGRDGCVATEQPRERKRSGGNENADRWYGPFPVDTGPLLIVSETTAAGVALEREIRLRCAEAEAKIPARWR